uniref:Uncharacterized protein n=1 Tax=Micrurus spixii TaxID=129469 RepID=A0A2D4MBH4_9SAUR
MTKCVNCCHTKAGLFIRDHLASMQWLDLHDVTGHAPLFGTMIIYFKLCFPSAAGMICNSHQISRIYSFLSFLLDSSSRMAEKPFNIKVYGHRSDPLRHNVKTSSISTFKHVVSIVLFIKTLRSQ